jgi:predicted nucleic acid-binding protein
MSSRESPCPTLLCRTLSIGSDIRPGSPAALPAMLSARRTAVLSALKELPRITAVDQEEALRFLEAHALPGRGLGWIDTHLLASARLVDVPFWTHDKRLAAVARELSLTLRED